MRLVKNKASGKYFILLDYDDLQGTDFLLITPEGKIKRLERHLFDETMDRFDSNETLLSHRLTEAQLGKYQEILDTTSPLN